MYIGVRGMGSIWEWYREKKPEDWIRNAIVKLFDIHTNRTLFDRLDECRDNMTGPVNMSLDVLSYYKSLEPVNSTEAEEEEDKGSSNPYYLYYSYYYGNYGSDLSSCEDFGTDNFTTPYDENILEMCSGYIEQCDHYIVTKLRLAGKMLEEDTGLTTQWEKLPVTLEKYYDYFNQTFTNASGEWRDNEGHEKCLNYTNYVSTL